MTTKLEHLFSPCSIKGMALKNRAVMPAMGTAFANKDSTVSERLIAYLERRARAGVGLIITEVCAIDPRGRGFGRELGVWNDSFITGLKQLTDSIHKLDTKIALQLHHAGRETMEGVVGAKPEGPSEVPSVILNQPTEAMSPDRIREIVIAYANGVYRAREAGFDAAEIHGAHGYLINQFLSPFSNRRNDQYGGSDENRSRILIEIIRTAREKVGPDYPIIVRLSADECIKGGYDLEFTKRIAPRLVEAGASALHVSVGVFSSPGMLTIATADTPEGFNLFRAREIKNIVDVPVIGVGRISDPRMADEAIARGDADLVAIGRQLLADPDVLVKAKEGRWDDIRWCLGCNQGCIERLSFEFKSTTCTINPECGKENANIYSKTGSRKKVWIVGGGPAGLQAAFAAGKRGHEVSLFERGPAVGGQLISASKPPHKEAFYKWVMWIQSQLKQMAIPVSTGVAMNEKTLADGRPDMVVLATGALPVYPRIKGIDGSHVVDARDVLEGKVGVTGPAVILGAGYVGMETGDYCIARGIQVTIVDMAKFPPVSKMPAHGYWLHRRLRDGGGVLMLNSMVTAIEETAVLVTQEGSEIRIEPVKTVIRAFGSAPERELADVLKKLNIPFAEAGDVVKPRRLIEAIHEGDAAGVSV